MTNATVKMNTPVFSYSRFQQLLLMFLLAVPAVVNAAANLMVTPPRVVFEDRTRTAQVTLVNQGDETGEFRISFIRQNMTESGQFVSVEADAEGMYADPMIRFSPRQVRLPPGQSQVVRLMLRKPRDLADGEYRSHMLFQTLPKPTTGSLESAIDPTQKGITVEITPLVGISIPVIVRHGKLESGVKLENARIIPPSDKDPKSYVLLEMHRSGNKSVYGDFRAAYIPNGGGKPVTIGLANGVAIYTTNDMRTFALPLNIPQGIALENGQVHIMYLEAGKDAESGLLAEITIDL